MTSNIDQQALDYHRLPKPGKLATHVTKPTATPEDLSLAYTPGVAAPVRAIAENPLNAYTYTNKGNTVAVVTNGSAILGLGNLGALASKPVMEGKAVLFKTLADVDACDILLDTSDPDALIQAAAMMAPTFGGINLEDIKAPECFQIERELQARVDIPVFHDDQHGTAITLAAGLMNALEIQGKSIDAVKVVCLGAGAAGIACMAMLQTLGLPKENLRLLDRQGVITTDRPASLPSHKAAFAVTTDDRTLDDAMAGADVFIGLSGPNLVTEAMVISMADRPVIMALSNPEPEVHPDVVQRVRTDAIMCTGRSDFPNQINNVLCFPYMFRGALDARATCINDAMKLAAVHALRELTKQPIPASVQELYPDCNGLNFGPAYVLPKPTDPRLRDAVASAVERAAHASGVARRAP